VCGILESSGEISCWGDLLYDTGTTQHPPARNPNNPFVELVAGNRHNCVGRTDNSVTCWGLNTVGQSAEQADLFASVGAGPNLTCGVYASDTKRILCWGVAAQAGVRDAPSGRHFRSWAGALDGGDGFACAVRDDGTLQCWGAPPAGLPVSSGFTEVGGGTAFGCALGTTPDPGPPVQCWGTDTDGSVVEAPTGSGWSDLSVTGHQACAICKRASGCDIAEESSSLFGEVYCWGNTTGPTDW
jgi:hypothetical protein